MMQEYLAHPTLYLPRRPDQGARVLVLGDGIAPVLDIEVPEGRKFLHFDEYQGELLASRFQRFLVRTPVPYVADCWLSVSSRDRKLVWDIRPEFRSADWTEFVERSRRFMNSVNEFSSVAWALQDEVHANGSKANWSNLLSRCNELQFICFAWSESVFEAVEVGSELAMFEWEDEVFADFVSSKPKKVTQWLAAIRRWGSFMTNSPYCAVERWLHEFDYDQDYVKRFLVQSLEPQISLLRFVVCSQKLDAPFSRLCEGEPEELSVLRTARATEKRYRNNEIARLLHVSPQAVTNWKTRFPDIYPRQFKAAASTWREFLKEAFPDGKYLPEDIPLY